MSRDDQDDGGELVPFPELVARTGRPLSELVPVFLKQFHIVRGRSVATVRAYGSDLDVFLNEFCPRAGVVYPDQVRVQHLETFLGWLSKSRGLQPSTVARYRHSLLAFWEWLEHEEMVDRNPAAKTYAPKQRRKLIRSISLPLQDRLFAALASDLAPMGLRDYAIHASLGFAGLRASEVGKLKMEHLDLESRVLYVIEGKGGKDRPVPVLPPLDGILARYLTDARPALLRGRESPFVFISRNHGRALAHVACGTWSGAR